MPKNGASKGRQVYRCGNCKRYYAHGAAYIRLSAADREQRVALYGEGLSLSAMARSIGVTAPAVHRWVKKGAAALTRLRRRGRQRLESATGQQPAAVIDCVS